MAAFEMNVQVKVDLKGLDTSGLTHFMKKVVFIAAHNVERRAKDLVLVDTGDTKGSIYVSPSLPSMSHTVGPTTEYAPFIEYGTVKWAGKAFMIPALEAEREGFQDAMFQVLSLNPQVDY